MNRLRRISSVVCVAMLCQIGAGLPTRAATENASSVARTKTVTRTHLVDGTDQTVDSRNVSVEVSTTKNLRDRQAVTVSWKGAHPTGGLVTDQTTAAAAQQEYPVVVMQCRGIDSATAATGKRVSPETCWTQTPGERFEYSASGSSFPSYRMDRYATTADRASAVNQPDPLPAACPDVPVPHWIPFHAADGTVYPGGNLGCAGLAPEAANSADSLQPGNTTYGVSDAKGSGSTKFVMQNADTNASVGCSQTVVCTLEIIPIMGISCDAAGNAASPGGMPPADRPPASSVDPIFQRCAQTGHFTPGVFNGGGEDPEVPVTGALWWSASNWRNRISVPLTFAASGSVCDVVTNQSTLYLYGSEALDQATQQWAPSFCLNSSLFTLRHVQSSEPQAKNLLAIGNVDAAIQAGPPQTPFPKPVVQAPAAVTGWAIAYSVDGDDGHPYPDLKLDARLIAKLLSESYRSCADCLDFTSTAAKKAGFAAMASNPIDISRDPEFHALNPGISSTNSLQSAATLSVMSSDADLMTAVSSYIDADPEARSWLDGKPDPWGMIVNPAYKHLALPVTTWPLLDDHIPVLAPGSNPCLAESPVPWLPLVASPLSNPATIALDLQFDVANSQTTCSHSGALKLGPIGREPAGSRFIFGLVGLGDAVRYQLNTAQLQTQRSSTGTSTFDDASGRTFAAATDSGMKAAGALLNPNDKIGTWTLPYNTLRVDPSGAKAYPGAVLMSIDVPTKGLAAGLAKRYAQLLHFVAGPGQVAGLANGQLPPGYLSLSRANGLGALAEYTDKAADAVAAQRGVVPFVSGKATPTGTGPDGRPSSPAGSPSSGSGDSPAPGSEGGGAASSRPTNGPSGSNSAGPTTGSSVNAAQVSSTTNIGSGILGLALPALLLGALLAAGVAAWTSGVGRR
jgi:hypothetical protein